LTQTPCCIKIIQQQPSRQVPFNADSLVAPLVESRASWRLGGLCEAFAIAAPKLMEPSCRKGNCRVKLSAVGAGQIRPDPIQLFPCSMLPSLSPCNPPLHRYEILPLLPKATTWYFTYRRSPPYICTVMYGVQDAKHRDVETKPRFRLDWGILPVSCSSPVCSIRLRFADRGFLFKQFRQSCSFFGRSSTAGNLDETT
jgi:hypothetical protein